MQQPGRDPKEILKDPYLQKWLPKWHNNAMENYPRIKIDFGIVRNKDSSYTASKNICVSSHQRPMNRPAIVIGSGPSLDKVAPLLKNWKHPIFASASNAFVAARFDREPEYICAYDSHWTVLRQLGLKQYNWKNSILLTHPYAEPEMIRQWKGKKLYYRRFYTGMEFSEVILPMMFPWIRVGFTVTGSVVNNAVTIANFWGYSPIFLIGCDMGWRDNDARRATLYSPKGNGEWNTSIPETTEHLNKTPQSNKEIINLKDGLKTSSSFLSFKDALYQILKSSKFQLIDCSDGILTELSHADPVEVIEKQGYGFERLFKSNPEIIAVVDAYFRSKVENKNKEEKRMYASTGFTGNYTLEELSKKYNSDKQWRHNYIPIFEKYFKPIKETAKKVFEIGIFQGASHRMWIDYFLNAKIYGMDIRDCSNFSIDKLITFIGDQQNRTHLDIFIKGHGEDFDIIIDDGSHSMEGQQVPFAFLFKYVKKGGLYIIEDLHTSYDPKIDKKSANPTNTQRTTFKIVEQLSKKERILSDFMFEEEISYIMENTEFCNIEEGSISKIAFIRKEK